MCRGREIQASDLGLNFSVRRTESGRAQLEAVEALLIERPWDVFRATLAKLPKH
jgi:hypothetical protein